MNFLQIATGRKVTALMLQQQFKLDPYDAATAFENGFARIEYLTYPRPDAMYYTVRPKAELTKMSDDRYVQEFEVVPLPLEIVRPAIKSKVAEKRWERETAGITLPDGKLVKTDIDSQTRLYNKINSMVLTGEKTTRFKFVGADFEEISKTDLKNVGKLVSKYSQACFDRECALNRKIDEAETVEELKSIMDFEIDTGWPEQEYEKQSTDASA